MFLFVNHLPWPLGLARDWGLFHISHTTLSTASMLKTLKTCEKHVTNDIVFNIIVSNQALVHTTSFHGSMFFNQKIFPMVICHLLCSLSSRLFCSVWVALISVNIVDCGNVGQTCCILCLYCERNCMFSHNSRAALV